MKNWRLNSPVYCLKVKCEEEEKDKTCMSKLNGFRCFHTFFVHGFLCKIKIMF